jgi:hypothetical protein
MIWSPGGPPHRATPGHWRTPALFFLVAVVLYLPGIWWGMPYDAPLRARPWGWDELAPLQSVTEVWGVFFAKNPSFNPQYPLMQNMVQAVLVLPYMLWLWLSGGLSTPGPTYPFGFVDPAASLAMTTLLSRFASVLMAAGTVVAAWRTATLLWDEATGRIAAVFVLTMSPMFFFGKTSNVDMGALFWTAMGLMVFAEILRDTLTTRRAILIGLYAALAPATKDANYSVFLVAGLVLAGVHLSRARQDGVPPGTAIRPLAIGFVTALACYVMASGLIFRPSRFMEHLQWITDSGLDVPIRFPATVSGYLGLGGRMLEVIAECLGGPVAALAAAGVVLCVARDRRAALWGLPAVGIPLLVLLPARFVFLRFLLPVAYVLALFAAAAVGAMRRAALQPLRALAPACVVVAAGWSLLHGADFVQQMIFDARYEAGDWLHAHARPGDRIAYFGRSAQLPVVEAGVTVVPRRESLHVSGEPDPEFVLLESMTFYADADRDQDIPPAADRELRAGPEYRKVLDVQTPAWFRPRAIWFFNPRVEIFARADVTDGRRLAAR